MPAFYFPPRTAKPYSAVEERRNLRRCSEFLDMIANVVTRQPITDDSELQIRRRVMSLFATTARANGRLGEDGRIEEGFHVVVEADPIKRSVDLCYFLFREGEWCEVPFEEAAQAAGVVT